MNRPGEDDVFEELKTLIAEEKRAALAALDAEAFARRVRRAVAASAGPERKRPAWWSRPALAGAFALLVVASAAAWWGLRPSPRLDARAVAAALGRVDFFGVAALSTPARAAGRVAPDGARSDLEWALQALVHRARRTNASRPVRERDVATALAAAASGGTAPARAFEWTGVSSAALARRLATFSREGTLVRALARAN